MRKFFGSKNSPGAADIFDRATFGLDSPAGSGIINYFDSGKFMA